MIIDRELSWLSFNARVLQEAEDLRVPLLERLFFCGVFSSNLDEFFRVRVASLRALMRPGPNGEVGGPRPHRLLHEIHREVLDLQERYGRTLASLRDELEREGIRMVTDETVPPSLRPHLERVFDESIREHTEPRFLPRDGSCRPFLRNGVVYLVVELWPREGGTDSDWAPTYGLVPVPSPPLPRFVELPDVDGDHVVMFLDDVIRCNLHRLLPEWQVGRAFAVKLTRDATLHIEDEFDGDLEAAIRASLRHRDAGAPSRFLYDMRAPYVLVHRLQHGLDLSEEDLVLGGRYHNLSDYMSFPRFGREDLSFPSWPHHPHPTLTDAPSLIAEVGLKDQILHTPYQSFDAVIRLLEEAAADPLVEDLSLTVYRVARDSRVLTALETAAKAGKRVTVFFEVQARFDEASNLGWADRLRAAGARVLSSMPDLKVHTKLALIGRREGEARRLYAFVGTGNFNEKTATVYADHGLFTADERITRDVDEVFRFLVGETSEPDVRHLLVAPFCLRSGLTRLLDEVIAAARAGQPASLTLKLNALEDPGIIHHLYRAAEAGVDVAAVVRGICCIVPEAEQASGRIRVRSIVDRYLEHARIYVFKAGEEEHTYLASADWMSRNLNRRVEVAVPIFDPNVRAQLHTLLRLQLADDTKARVLDGERGNVYVDQVPKDQRTRAQEAFRDYVAGMA